jgi:hypothetical protein
MMFRRALLDLARYTGINYAMKQGRKRSDGWMDARASCVGREIWECNFKRRNDAVPLPRTREQYSIIYLILDYVRESDSLILRRGGG